MKSIRRFFCIFVLILSSFASFRATAIEHYPLILPAVIDGVGRFIGAGYVAGELFGEGTFAALGYFGDMQGISASANNWSFADDWLTVDWRIIHLNKFTPLNNYQRVSKTSDATFRPSLTLTSAEVSLHTGYKGFRFSLIPGTNSAAFESFQESDGDTIAIDSIHITDLEQSYNKLEFGYKHNFSSSEYRYGQGYLDANLRYTSQGKSSGFSGSNITSVTLSGQYNLPSNFSIFGQIFRSDAVAVKSPIQGEAEVAETLDMDCTNSGDSCRRLGSSLVSYIAANNQYGTAESLGGPERMKAYPVNYLRAAHARYITLEARFINRGSSNERQVFLHIFDEIGAVSDSTGELTDNLLRSTGVELGLAINEKHVYKLTAAKGALGWTGHLSLTRSW